MATIRCPICGTINPNGKRRLARCRRCHEDLAGCRYCLHYHPHMMDCLHPARPDWLRITDPTESVNCPDFTTTLNTSRAHTQTINLFRTAVVTVTLSLIVIFGGMGIYHAMTGGGAETTLTAVANAPGETTTEEGLTVRVTVTNEGARLARQVEVRVGGKSLRDLRCDAVEPEGCAIERGKRDIRARIALIEPGNTASFGFHFRPEEPGEVKLVAQVVAANAKSMPSMTVQSEILP